MTDPLPASAFDSFGDDPFQILDVDGLAGEVMLIEDLRIFVPASGHHGDDRIACLQITGLDQLADTGQGRGGGGLGEDPLPAHEDLRGLHLLVAHRHERPAVLPGLPDHLAAARRVGVFEDVVEGVGVLVLFHGIDARLEGLHHGIIPQGLHADHARDLLDEPDAMKFLQPFQDAPEDAAGADGDGDIVRGPEGELLADLETDRLGPLHPEGDIGVDEVDPQLVADLQGLVVEVPVETLHHEEIGVIDGNGIDLFLGDVSLEKDEGFEAGLGPEGGDGSGHVAGRDRPDPLVSQGEGVLEAAGRSPVLEGPGGVHRLVLEVQVLQADLPADYAWSGSAGCSLLPGRPNGHSPQKGRTPGISPEEKGSSCAGCCGRPSAPGTPPAGAPRRSSGPREA